MPELLEQLHESYVQGLEEAALQPEPLCRSANQDQGLANVYLHYVLDLWVDWWRRRHAHGDVIIVRWADDFIVGFEHEQDAQRFLVGLRGRLAGFGLELHPDKTRLIEFGRHAAQRRQQRGLGKPERFDFLDLTHICATSRSGRFWLRRITIAKRTRAKLHEVNDQLRRRRYQPVSVQGRWLESVVRGHLAYYAVPGNNDAVNASRYQVTRRWFRRCGAAAIAHGSPGRE